MNHPDIPRQALSIMHPWAWLIVNGHKTIENRDWATKYRGPVAIHAGKKFDAGALIDLRNRTHPVTGDELPIDPWESASFGAMSIGNRNGGIVGVAEIVDCIDASDDPWFVGRYGFVMTNARPVEFIPVKGALSFFDWRKMLERDAA